MKLALNIIALVLLALGALWTLQGANIIGGSFMSGQSQWLIIGIVSLIAGLGMLYWANRRTTPHL